MQSWVQGQQIAPPIGSRARTVDVYNRTETYTPLHIKRLADRDLQILEVMILKSISDTLQKYSSST